MHLEKALEILNFKELTEVQKQTIPLLTAKQDLLVLAPTGTGKTYAFLLPMLQLKEPFSGLVIVPTRELALQIKDFYDALQTGNSCIAIYGGKVSSDDLASLNNNPTLVISTPGRLLDICEKKNFFKKIEFLILDEADKLFQLGFLNTILKIISYLNEKRTTALFSATLNVDFSPIKMVNPKVINVINKHEIELYFSKVTGIDKLSLLYNLINNQNKIIVFFSTCACVDFFYELFTKLDFKISKIHGKMKQNEREGVYNNYQILFSTDLAARGIDFKDVHTVIHFDVPVDPSNFIHRSGRTGRNGRDGRVILFLNNNEEKYLNYLEVKKIPIIELTDKFTSQHNFDFFNKVIDDKLLDLSVKAFVSFIRSYKEHILKYILNIKELDFNKLIQMYFLKKVPRMDELSNVKFEKFKKIRKNDKKSSIKINKQNKRKQKNK